MEFKKQDLSGTDYTWQENEEHLFVGQPSRRTFDRYNGNQVLFLINFCGSFLDHFTTAEGQSLEQRIRQDLPLEMKSEISVINWIKNMVSAEK